MAFQIGEAVRTPNGNGRIETVERDRLYGVRRFADGGTNVYAERELLGLNAGHSIRDRSTPAGGLTVEGDFKRRWNTNQTGWPG